MGQINRGRTNKNKKSIKQILEERAGSEEAAAPDQSELTHMMGELEQLKGQMKMMVQLMTAMVSSRGIEPSSLKSSSTKKKWTRRSKRRGNPIPSQFCHLAYFQN